ncbi:hypothetical protein HHK36_020058 [Tetracentron sinense]|uniref:DDE Tnp4 domain-containing protein n=1 Tax=Tetracentron sinense TaxID=13715 RepID=A0A834YTE5_TETSI|nr:hypothetical protein HHK36_020058 [Tetracentron sinense]
MDEDNNLDTRVISQIITGAASTVIAVGVTVILVVDSMYNIPKEPHINREKEREDYINSIIHGSDSHCIDQIRMSPRAFYRLCEVLRNKNLLRPTINVSIEEQVVTFLHLIGHNVRLRVIGSRFHRSCETIHRYFNVVLRAIMKLHKDLIRPPICYTSPEIQRNRRYWPWFEDCIGAIDGTHVRASFPIALQARFRGRKEGTTQNVLAVVSFDLKFMYVLAGWEGSAHDSHILDDALSRPNGLRVPEGKYLLGDAGYGLRNGFIPPYRGVRYHLKEYSNHSPENEKELFNLRHSSLRTTVERAFGVLKKRFRVLDVEPYWSYKTQVDIILACCVLHNHIMGVDPTDDITRDVERELQSETQGTQLIRMTQREEREENREWAIKRDAIANAMYNDYINRGNMLR